MISMKLYIECFVSAGNHYGTPKPPKDPKDSAKDGPMPRDTMPTTTTTSLPGQHPSSEGKRKRNRSTIEATNRSPITRPDGSPPPPPSDGRNYPSRDGDGDADNLGPLPSNWEMAFTDDGTAYFIE